MTVSPSILIVEDGTVVENANSYVTFEFVEEYHSLRGNSQWTDFDGNVLDKQNAIIRATQALDGVYASKWLGSKKDALNQTLQFPRSGIVVGDTEYPSNVIPKQIMFAVCEFALKELVSPNSILVDQERGGDIKRVKADTVEVEYMSKASSGTTYKSVDVLVSGFVSGTSSSSIGSGDIGINW